MVYKYQQIDLPITTTTVYGPPAVAYNARIFVCLVTSTTASVRAFRVESDNSITELTINGLIASQAFSVAIHPDGTYLLVYYGTAHYAWKYNSSTDTYDYLGLLTVASTRILGMAWLADSTHVYCAGYFTSNSRVRGHVLTLTPATNTFNNTNNQIHLDGYCRNYAVAGHSENQVFTSDASGNAYIEYVTSTSAINTRLTSKEAGTWASWKSDDSYVVAGVTTARLFKKTGSGATSSYTKLSDFASSVIKPQYIGGDIIMCQATTGGAFSFFYQEDDNVIATDTPDGLEDIISLTGTTYTQNQFSTNNLLLLVHNGTSLYVFEAIHMEELQADFLYPSYGIESQVNNPIALVEGYNFPVYENAGVLNVPISIIGADFNYPIYTAQGSGGVFEAQYTTAYEPLYSMIASVASAEYDELDPVETYGYGNFEYSKYSTDASVSIQNLIVSEVWYPSYEWRGFLNLIEINGEFIYPSGYLIEGDLYNLKEFTGSIQYPFFDIDANVILSTSGSGEFSYSNYTVASTVTTSVINANLTYPLVTVEGLIEVSYSEGSADLEYSLFEASANIIAINNVTANLTYSTIKTNGDVEIQPWISSDISYPVYNMEGTINAPIGAFVDVIYPTFRTSGVVGVKVSINDEVTYPVFRIFGTLEFTAVADANMRYPLYQIDGYSGANPVVEEGPLIYPIFGVDYQIENYYGVSSNSMLSINSESSINEIGARKNLFITEH